MSEYRKPSHSRDEQIDLTCPTPVDTLAQVMAGSSRRRPKMFPIDNRDAAIFWINHQEKRDDYAEAATREGATWKTPYHDRLTRTLRIFLGLNDLHQAFVIEYTKTIPWRGDDIDLYQIVVKETQLMAGDPNGYIQKTLKAMKDFNFSRVPDMPNTSAGEADEQSKKPLGA